MATRDEHALLELVQRIAPGSTLRQAWHMTGGVSAQVTALDVDMPDGRTVRLIVRRHGEIDRAANPHIARDEYRLLEIARHHSVLAPRPVYLDESCDLFPTPVLVIEFIEGETDAIPMSPDDHLGQIAAELAKIHAIEDSPLLSFLPRRIAIPGSRPQALDDSMQEGRIRDTLESNRPFRQLNRNVLLHGDFWPGNLLWKDEKLVAVLDWEDARVGDPLSDLGNTRMEILFQHGKTAMKAFTERYHALTDTDLTNLPFWDLAAALRPCGRITGWGLDEPTETRMRRRHARFVERAIERLPAG